MFNFATINVNFRFTDIVFLPIWCENNEIFLFDVYRKLVGIKPSRECMQLNIYLLNKVVKHVCEWNRLVSSAKSIGLIISETCSMSFIIYTCIYIYEE